MLMLFCSSNILLSQDDSTFQKNMFFGKDYDLEMFEDIEYFRTILDDGFKNIDTKIVLDDSLYHCVESLKIYFKHYTTDKFLLKTANT